MKLNCTKALSLLALIAASNYTRAETFIYNMPLDRAALPPFFYGNWQHCLSLSATGFGQVRQHKDAKPDCEHRGVGAGMFKFAYLYDPVWVGLKVIAGSEFHRNENKEIHNSNAKLDDILLSAGIVGQWGEGQQINVYGLAGFPTHEPVKFNAPQELGTGHYSAGVEADGFFPYYCCDETQHAFLLNVRYVHFFPRDVKHHLDENKTIERHLPNLVDVLIGNHSMWGGHHLELGYNPEFGFGAKARDITDLNKVRERESHHWLRNNIYGNYFYEWCFDGFSTTLGLGGSLGITHRKDKQNSAEDRRNDLRGTFWINLGLNF